MCHTCSQCVCLHLDILLHCSSLFTDSIYVILQMAHIDVLDLRNKILPWSYIGVSSPLSHFLCHFILLPTSNLQLPLRHLCVDARTPTVVCRHILRWRSTPFQPNRNLGLPRVAPEALKIVTEVGKSPRFSDYFPQEVAKRIVMSMFYCLELNNVFFWKW